MGPGVRKSNHSICKPFSASRFACPFTHSPAENAWLITSCKHRLIVHAALSMGTWQVLLLNLPFRHFVATSTQSDLHIQKNGRSGKLSSLALATAICHSMALPDAVTCWCMMALCLQRRVPTLCLLNCVLS